MLSYTRRYWRRCQMRKTNTDLGRELLRVLKPNPKKARTSCRKFKKLQMSAEKGERVAKAGNRAWACTTRESRRQIMTQLFDRYCFTGSV